MQASTKTVDLLNVKEQQSVASLSPSRQTLSSSFERPRRPVGSSSAGYMKIEDPPSPLEMTVLNANRQTYHNVNQ